MAKRFLSTKNETLVVRFLVIVVAYFLLRSIARKNAERDAQNALLTGDENALYATELRQAMNPSGYTWLMGVDFTNTEAIFNTARKIRDFDKVSSYYRSLYQSDLVQDLQKELSPADFQKFLSLLGKGGASGKIYARTNNVPAYAAKGEGDNWEIDFSSPVDTFSAGEYLTDEVIANAVYANAQGKEFKYYIFKTSNWFLFSRTVAVDVNNLLEK